jgi:hypothetical protein
LYKITYYAPSLKPFDSKPLHFGSESELRLDEMKTNGVNIILRSKTGELGQTTGERIILSNLNKIFHIK